MINTTNVDTTKNNNNTSKYLSPGIYEVKVNNITTFQANSGSYQFKFELETPAINTEGFVPAEGFQGQVGTVRTVYLANEAMEAQVGQMIAHLADVTGTREQVNNLSQDLTYPEYAEQLTNLVKDKYFWTSISGKKYVNRTNGKVGTELQFSRFKTFASKAEVEEKGVDKCLAKPFIRELAPESTDTTKEVLF